MIPIPDSLLLEEAIALLEQKTKADYDEDFKFGRLASAKMNRQKLLHLKDLREKLQLAISE